MPQYPNSSFTSPKLEMRSCVRKGGFGLFARESLKKGEILCVWGGEIVTEEQLENIPPERAKHGLQVEESIYLLPLQEGDPGDYVNHSCDPNAGLIGQICMVAMRDINADEEVCFDYAMSDSSDYDEFQCQCGSDICRVTITGNDWKIPALQEKYYGYFIPYLQRRIDVLKGKHNGHKKNGRSELEKTVELPVVE
jgi:SET domain-containing protein